MTGVGLIVLTGGASLRMGSDKATLEAGGGPLAARPVVALRALVDEVVLAGRAVPGVEGRVVADTTAGAGPLAGVVAGLGELRSPLAVVVACDMPTVRAAVVGALLAALHPEGGPVASACASASTPGELEPLPMALVRAAALAPMRRALAGRGSLRDGLDLAGCAVLPPEAWRPLDPEGASFVSWNRPEDVGPLP